MKTPIKVALVTASGLILVGFFQFVIQPYITSRQQPVVTEVREPVVPEVTVSGRVGDGRTNNGITGANVSVTGFPDPSTSESNGYFLLAFKQTKKGDAVRLHVQKMGYKSADVSVTPPREGVEVLLTPETSSEPNGVATEVPPDKPPKTKGDDTKKANPVVVQVGAQTNRSPCQTSVYAMPTPPHDDRPGNPIEGPPISCTGPTSGTPVQLVTVTGDAHIGSNLTFTIHVRACVVPASNENCSEYQIFEGARVNRLAPITINWAPKNLTVPADRRIRVLLATKYCQQGDPARNTFSGNGPCEATTVENIKVIF